jgi:hypothetical protein
VAQVIFEPLGTMVQMNNMMKSKKIYARPALNKNVIDREISLVMLSVSVTPPAFKLFRFLR